MSPMNEKKHTKLTKNPKSNEAKARSIANPTNRATTKRDIWLV